MKTPGIYITGTDLIFKAFPSKEIGLAMYCKSFKVSLVEVKFIVLSPRMNFDDTVYLLLIITQNNIIHKIPISYISQGFDTLQNFFELKPLVVEDKKIKDDEFDGKLDKIIYPKAYYWQDLFKDNWKLKLRPLITMFHPKSCFGDFNSDLK